MLSIYCILRENLEIMLPWYSFQIGRKRFYFQFDFERLRLYCLLSTLFRS